MREERGQMTSEKKGRVMRDRLAFHVRRKACK